MPSSVTIHSFLHATFSSCSLFAFPFLYDIPQKHVCSLREFLQVSAPSALQPFCHDPYKADILLMEENWNKMGAVLPLLGIFSERELKESGVREALLLLTLWIRAGAELDRCKPRSHAKRRAPVRVKLGPPWSAVWQGRESRLRILLDPPRNAAKRVECLHLRWVQLSLLDHPNI